MTVLPSETPISQVVRDVSASNNGGSSVLTTILVIVTILLATGGGVMKWLYPNTIEDVEAQIRVVDELIESNMDLERDILGDSAWLFKDRLIRENEAAAKIRNRMNAEPNRKDVLPWLVFRWRQMKDVEASSLAVMELKENLTRGKRETMTKADARAKEWCFRSPWVSSSMSGSAGPNSAPGEDGHSAKETKVVKPSSFL